MREHYPHMPFQKRWQLSPSAMYELGQCDAIIQAISGTPLLPEYHADLLRVSLSKGAQATTAIEGNTLSLDEVKRVLGGQSLPPSKEYQAIEVRNILAGFNVILVEAVEDGRGDLVTADLLRRFHQIIGRDLGEHFAAVPGRFRTDRRHVGPYLTPDPDDVPELVDTLCEWIRREFHYSSGQSIAEAIVQAIITHVYIEWIHPFGVGNGRTGRLVEYYILVRAGLPDIASHILSNHYNDTRPEYYRLLHRANEERELTCFIEYAVRGFRDGLITTLTRVQDSQFAMSWQKVIHDRFAGRRMTNRHTFVRQRSLMLEMPSTMVGLRDIRRLSPVIASLYAETSERTLRRDMEALEEMGLVVRETSGWRAKTELLGSNFAQRRKDAAQPASSDAWRRKSRDAGEENN
jgi:Fic family protein